MKSYSKAGEDKNPVCYKFKKKHGPLQQWWTTPDRQKQVLILCERSNAGSSLREMQKTLLYAQEKQYRARRTSARAYYTKRMQSPGFGRMRQQENQVRPCHE